MKLTSDWHIHTRNSCDSASLLVADLVAGARAQGILDFGITDHIHTPFNLPDLVASRQEYLESDPSRRFHFGIEASCVSQWEMDEVATGRHANPVYGLRSGGPAWGPLALGIGREEMERLGVEYVVGGTHWPMYLPPDRDAIIRDYHRQNLFLAAHPLVTIVAHPWWWMGYWKDDDGQYRGDPWLDDFGKIPTSMHDEFAAAAIEHGKIVEANISANLCNGTYPESFGRQYAEYLAGLKERGVRLSLASDCHSPQYTARFEEAAALLESVGIRDEEFWRLPARGGDRDGVNG